MQNYDVVVVGGGIIGLSIAWQAQLSGRRVLLVDPAPASGATFAAAGMLAPISEFHHQERALQSLMLASVRCWPEFLSSLANGVSTGRKLTDDELAAEAGYRTEGTLLLGVDVADRVVLADLVAAQTQAGLAVQRLTLAELRGLEPLLGPQVGAFGYFAAADHQVDPRRLAAMLSARLEIVRARAGRIGPGLVELIDGTVLHATDVIVANGLAAAELAGVPLPLPLRPVHGDILRLAVPEPLQPLLNHTVRGLVRGSSVYLLPRRDNTVVIGATQREDGHAGVSAGGTYQLLRDAQTLFPAVAELTLLESTARARPGTPDNAPLLGRVTEGLIVATGMFRHGVLLAPVVAKICCDILDRRFDPEWEQFAVARFDPVALADQGAR